MSSNIVVRHGTDLRENEVVRYTLVERMCHWVAGISYLYVLASGLALFTPYLYWLAYVLGGGPTIRFWHPWAGLVFVAGVLWMHKLWGGDMKTTREDLEWRKTVKAYVTNDDAHVAPAGHFNSGQKQFYWIMFYGGLLLLVTGLLMWFAELVLRAQGDIGRSHADADYSVPALRWRAGDHRRVHYSRLHGHFLCTGRIARHYFRSRIHGMG